MQITADIGVEDFVKAYVQLRRLEPPPKKAGPSKLWIVSSLSMIAAFIFASLMAAFTGILPYYGAAVKTGLLACAIWMGVDSIGVIRILLKSRKAPDVIEMIAAGMREQHRKGEGALDVGRHLITITPEGMEDVGEDWQFFRAWRQIQSIQDVPDYVMICRGSKGGFPIPKRAFGSEGAAAAFLAEARHFHMAAGGHHPPITG